MDEEKKSLDAESRPVIGNFTLQAKMPNEGVITFSGYMYQGEAVQSLNDRLDIVNAVLDRQRTRAEIPLLEANREQIIERMRQTKEVMEELLEKKRTDKASSQERMTLKNMQVGMKKMGEDLEKGEIAIAEAKKKTGTN